jgi:NAD(P)-dependent dehydrogenase (short-subunit alcohol dehydrogenase family)
MPTVVVTGANRGLGLEFTRQYAADGSTVIATCRDPAKAGDLAALEGDIRVERLDVTDWAALGAFARGLGSTPLDLLICNAGIGGWGEPEPDAWLHSFAVNCIAPTLLARALVDRVEAAGGKIVCLTSKMGSIADNTSGGSIVYRSAKAALNAAWRSLAIDWKDRPVTVTMLHPGWVQTDMGGANALITPDESIAGMRRVIDGLPRDRSGAFLDYKGESIPW